MDLPPFLVYDYQVGSFEEAPGNVPGAWTDSDRDTTTGSKHLTVKEGLMKSLLMFWREVLAELGTWCRVDTALDLETVQRRFEQEGTEFFTLTLPRFAKDFESSLEQNMVTPDLFVGFKKRGNLPVFLGGFLELLFDRKTGVLLAWEEWDETPISAVEAVFAIRQLTLLFGKVLPILDPEKDNRLGCTPEREQAAYDAFSSCEQELKEFWGSNDFDVATRRAETQYEFTHASRFLFRHVLTALDNELFTAPWALTETEGSRWNTSPKHGPGATADKLTGNSKYDQYEWTQRLEEVFPFGEFAIPSWRYSYLLDRVQFLEPGAERPVKVIAVPKTHEKPRIIAVEPTCMQYMQQMVQRRLRELLENDSITRGMIGFDDQEPNQQLAMEGSLTKDLATLDLSEASDRISWQLVSEDLWYPGSPFIQALDATRSRRADVPGHGIISLAKYASMGSALCFPIMSMVNLTCAFVGIAKSLNRPVDASLVREFRSSVRVYGDDIIVPTVHAVAVIETLEALGLKVNRRKSFWAGRFRESCGGDFYAGEDVSITRVRREFPRSRHDVPEVISLASLRNQFYYSGMWRTAGYLDTLLKDVLVHLPTVTPESSAVGRHSILGYQTDKIGENDHAPLVKGYVVASKPPRSPISGEGALLKCLLSGPTEQDDFGFLVPLDDGHLERQGRPDAVRLKLRWVRPF